MSRTRRRFTLPGFLAAGAVLFGCVPDGPAPDSGPHSFSIAIASSNVAERGRFGGSYAIEVDGQRVTRDLSGFGAHAVHFDADRLLFVRVHAASDGGLHSLTIRRDDETLFETAAVPSSEPLLYHARGAATR